MEFKKYMHIERFGTTEVKDINFGECYIFPKIDGTNGSVWIDDNRVKAASRNRELSLEYDNQGFYEWVLKQDNIKDFLNHYSGVRLFGEWLVPHALRTYRDDAWKNFYVFDVMVDDRYLSYDEYSGMLGAFEIEYIPPICKIKNPTFDRLVRQLEKSTYLIKDGEGKGEGIVIKNYDYKNQYGRTVWAKIVSNDFKAKHQKCDVGEIKEKKLIEEKIATKYVTKALVEKEFTKIENDGGWTSKKIPRLLNTVYYCVVKEESWNFVKEHKNPTIDFRMLMNLVIQRIKTLKPELF